jgi:hypothetical protein
MKNSMCGFLIAIILLITLIMLWETLQGIRFKIKQQLLFDLENNFKENKNLINI